MLGNALPGIWNSPSLKKQGPKLSFSLPSEPPGLAPKRATATSPDIILPYRRNYSRSLTRSPGERDPDPPASFICL